MKSLILTKKIDYKGNTFRVNFKKKKQTKVKRKNIEKIMSRNIPEMCTRGQSDKCRVLICILPLDLIYVHVAVGDGIDGQCRHAFQAELVHDVFAMGDDGG